MKKGTRLYINITNQCNTNCPFCCMYSGTDKHTYMDFNTFKEIIDTCEGDYELQLEGGEPLLHDNLYLFTQYAVQTGRCKKVILLTNGLLIEKHIKQIAEFANLNKIMVELKISINYWLISQKKDFIKLMDKINIMTSSMQFVDVCFNVRKRKKGDDDIDNLLEKYSLLDKSHVFFFQSYGKLSDSEYEKPVIVQNIDNWRIYASDGTCFNQDLIARSEYEKLLD